MKVIETSIVIEASADDVWMILTDLDNYANWNPFIVFARGHLVVGQRLCFRRGPDITTTLNHGMFTVINAEKHILSWTAHWITSRLLNTVYAFSIESVDLETACFTQRETLSGFVPLILRRGWFHTLQSHMVSKNKAIKRLAENKRHRLPRLWTTAE
jgi:hypothetical protein